MELTLDDYKLFTGDETTFSDDDWSIIVDEASERLASFLCRDALPNPLPTTLKDLLANFIFAVRRYQGAGEEEVESKHVRNFTIKFKSNRAANAFAQVANNYADIIEMFSECGLGLDVEKSKNYCCGRFYREDYYDRF